MVLEEQVDSTTTLEVGPDARRLYVEVDAGTDVRLMRGPVVMSEGRDGRVYVENPVAGRWTLEVGPPTMARGSVTY